MQRTQLDNNNVNEMQNWRRGRNLQAVKRFLECSSTKTFTDRLRHCRLDTVHVYRAGTGRIEDTIQPIRRYLGGYRRQSTVG